MPNDQPLSFVENANNIQEIGCSHLSEFLLNQYHESRWHDQRESKFERYSLNSFQLTAVLNMGLLDCLLKINNCIHISVITIFCTLWPVSVKLCGVVSCDMDINYPLNIVLCIYLPLPRTSRKERQDKVDETTREEISIAFEICQQNVSMKYTQLTLLLDDIIINLCLNIGVFSTYNSNLKINTHRITIA